MVSRLSYIDQLVTAGLVDKRLLPYARIVLSDPDQGIKSMVYRETASQIFTKISKMILTDQTLFQRIRQLLSVKKEDFDMPLTKDMSSSEVVDDIVHSKNKMFSGDSKRQRIKRALGAYYGMHKEQTEEISELTSVKQAKIKGIVKKTHKANPQNIRKVRSRSRIGY